MIRCAPFRVSSRYDRNLPAGDFGTELRVGATRDELDLIGHLIEHDQVDLKWLW